MKCLDCQAQFSIPKNSQAQNVCDECSMRLEEMAKEFDVPSSKRKRTQTLDSESTTSGSSSKKLLSSTGQTSSKPSLSASQEDIPLPINTTEESSQDQSELMDEPRKFRCEINIVSQEDDYDCRTKWSRIFQSESVHEIFHRLHCWNEYWYNDARVIFKK